MEMKPGQEKDIEQYLSTGELMGTLSISRSTINRMVKRGMPHVWVGAVRRFPVDQVVGWLEDQRGNKLNNGETSTAEI